MRPDPAPGLPRWARRRAWRAALESFLAVELRRRPADVVLGQLHTGPAVVRAASAGGAASVLLLPSHEALCVYAFAAGSRCRPRSGCRECPRVRALEPGERREAERSRTEHEEALVTAGALLAPSRAVSATVEAWCGRRPHLAAPVTVAPPSVLGDPAGPVVMLSSRWTVDKGAELLAPIANRLEGRRVLVQWSAAGLPGGVRDALARQPGVSLVEPGLPLAELLAGASAVVVPSQLPEAFGRVAFEAMACGVPVVASAIGGLKEHVPPAGLVRAIADPQAWSAAVRRLEDPGRWLEARDAGRASAAAVLRRDSVDTIESVLVRTSACGGPARSRAEHRAASPPAGCPALLWLLAHAYHPSGHAEEARVALRALEGHGLAPAAREVSDAGDPAIVACADRAMLEGQLARRPEPPLVAVHHYTPRVTPPIPDAVEVARVMWETDRLPSGWRELLEPRDEVWVPSRHNLQTFAAGGVAPERLRLVPECIDFEAFRPGLEPWPLDVPAGHFVFLSSFDFSERKGWRQLLLAWARAFEANDPVALVLKTGSVRAFSEREVRERIEDFIRKRLGRSALAPIRLIVGMLPTSNVPRLYAAADAYVSASRGEGWGRTYMEALATGLPTIGTRYGGNVDFMERDGAWLVGGELVPVRGDDDLLSPLYRGHRWFEADVDELASTLRELAGDPLAARASAAEARHDLMPDYAPQAFAERVAGYATAAVAAWGSRSEPSSSSATTRSKAEPKTSSSKRTAA